MTTTAAPPPNGTAPDRMTKADYAAGPDKPPTLPVNPDSIPTELKAKRRWVCWRWEKRDGKWTKPPFHPRTGARVDVASGRRSTWCTFEEALTAYLHPEKGYDGIGFALVAEDGFTGVDLDSCRDPDTGVVALWAGELLQALDTYAEVSPTGTGIKALVHARKPGTRCKAAYADGEVEVYERGRYFTFTGLTMLGMPSTIGQRQEALDALYHRVFPERQAGRDNRQQSRPHGNGTAWKGKAPPKRSAVWEKPLDKLTDEDIITLAREAKNAAKFSALWDGDTGRHGGDDSRADAALCSILAYWCRKDARRIDRLFCRSGLMRPKWDERHSGEGATYGEMTIAFAVEVCAEVYPGPRRKKSRKGKGKANAAPADGQDGDEEALFTVEIIRSYWRECYDFCFRRGKALFSRKLGREVPHSEACFAPCTELVDRLELAVDAPEDGRDGIPRHYREWAKVAWVDEWNAQQDETTSGELVDHAREQFRATVRGGLLTVVALAHGYQAGESGEETKVQKKPLLHFARSFAKGTRWADVRGLSIWSKKRPNSQVPRVALRVEVFGQVHYARLTGLSYDQFATLCELYDVGTRCKVQGGDTRAVELLPEFVADALDVPFDEPTATRETAPGGQTDGQDGVAGAHAREEASVCPGSEETHASQ